MAFLVATDDQVDDYILILTKIVNNNSYLQQNSALLSFLIVICTFIHQNEKTKMISTCLS